MKEEALGRTLWRNRFGRGFGPVAWQITDDDDDDDDDDDGGGGDDDDDIQSICRQLNMGTSEPGVGLLTLRRFNRYPSNLEPHTRKRFTLYQDCRPTQVDSSFYSVLFSFYP